MQRRWFKKRVVCVCLLSVFLYLIVRRRTHDVVFEVVIPNTKPVDIWEFVADFSNLKKIYPNIIDFNILSEGGNYDHWRYSARYQEFLLYLPYIRYFIDGHFNVKPAGGGTYVIQSTHNTCFLSGLFCCPDSSVAEVSSLLGCDTVSLSELFLMFEIIAFRVRQSKSSQVLDCLTLKTKASRFFEIPGTAHTVTDPRRLES